MSNLQKNVINNILKRILQSDKNFPNNALFKCMRLLGFSMDATRRAILEASGIKFNEVREPDMSLTSLYATFDLKNSAPAIRRGRELLAKEVGIEAFVFWQDDSEEINDLAA
jgi:hypothetical protein